MSKSDEPADDPRAERRRRLAEELRANLRRRKAPARVVREEPGPSGSEGDDASSDPRG